MSALKTSERPAPLNGPPSIPLTLAALFRYLEPSSATSFAHPRFRFAGSDDNKTGEGALSAVDDTAEELAASVASAARISTKVQQGRYRASVLSTDVVVGLTAIQGRGPLADLAATPKSLHSLARVIRASSGELRALCEVEDASGVGEGVPSTTTSTTTPTSTSAAVKAKEDANGGAKGTARGQREEEEEEEEGGVSGAAAAADEEGEDQQEEAAEKRRWASRDEEEKDTMLELAKIRLGALQALCLLANSEQRAVAICASDVPLVVARDVLDCPSTNFDLNALKAACDLLRNLALPSSKTLGSLLCCVPPLCVAAIAKARDQNAAASAAAALRLLLLAPSTPATDPKPTEKSAADVAVAMAPFVGRIIAMNLTKTHPFVRVELARSLALAAPQWVDFVNNQTAAASTAATTATASATATTKKATAMAVPSEAVAASTPTAVTGEAAALSVGAETDETGKETAKAGKADKAEAEGGVAVACESVLEALAVVGSVSGVRDYVGSFLLSSSHPPLHLEAVLCLLALQRAAATAAAAAAAGAAAATSAAAAFAAGAGAATGGGCGCAGATGGGFASSQQQLLWASLHGTLRDPLSLSISVAAPSPSSAPSSLSAVASAKGVEVLETQNSISLADRLNDLASAPGYPKQTKEGVRQLLASVNAKKVSKE